MKYSGVCWPWRNEMYNVQDFLQSLRRTLRRDCLSVNNTSSPGDACSSLYHLSCKSGVFRRHLCGFFSADACATRPVYFIFIAIRVTLKICYTSFNTLRPSGNYMYFSIDGIYGFRVIARVKSDYFWSMIDQTRLYDGEVFAFRYELNFLVLFRSVSASER